MSDVTMTEEGPVLPATCDPRPEVLPIYESQTLEGHEGTPVHCLASVVYRQASAFSCNGTTVWPGQCSTGVHG